LLLIELIRASGIDRALSPRWRCGVSRWRSAIRQDLAGSGDHACVGWELPGRCEPALVRIGRVRRVA